MIVYVIVGPIAYHVSLHLWKDIEYSDHSFIINIDICIVLQECSTEKDNSLKENEKIRRPHEFSRQCAALTSTLL